MVAAIKMDKVAHMEVDIKVDIVAAMEVDKGADMEGDMVADMEVYMPYILYGRWHGVHQLFF